MIKCSCSLSWKKLNQLKRRFSHYVFIYCFFVKIHIYYKKKILFLNVKKLWNILIYRWEKCLRKYYHRLFLNELQDTRFFGWNIFQYKKSNFMIFAVSKCWFIRKRWIKKITKTASQTNIKFNYWLPWTKQFLMLKTHFSF